MVRGWDVSPQQRTLTREAKCLTMQACLRMRAVNAKGPQGLPAGLAANLLLRLCYSGAI